MTPTFRILADRHEITDRIRDRLVSLTVTDQAGEESDSLELVVDDRDQRVSTPRKGAELRCYLGYTGRGVQDMGIYVVDEVSLESPPATMTIRAKAANVQSSPTVSKMSEALKSERTRSWHETTLGQIVTAIAQEAGYTPKISPALAAQAIPHIDQTSESNLHFLTRIARDRDALFKPAATHLLFLQRDAAALARVAIHRSSALSWNLTLAERDQYHSVRAYWHDHLSGETLLSVAGEGEPVRELRTPLASLEEASAAALAELARIRRGEARGDVTIPGNPLAVAEAHALLSAFREGFDGEWLIAKAIHTLSDSGYITKLELETPQ